ALCAHYPSSQAMSYRNILLRPTHSFSYNGRHHKRSVNQADDLSPLGSSSLPDPQPRGSTEREERKANREPMDSAPKSNSAISHHTSDCLLWTVAKIRSGHTTTGWRLSQRQHGRRPKGAF